MQLISQIIHGGNSSTQDLIAIEIILQQLINTLGNTWIVLFSGQKLPVIKSLGIIKQQFNLGDDHIVAHLVYTVLKFFFYISEK